MSLIPIAIERNFSGVLDRLASTLAVSKIRPNTISTFSLLTNLCASLLLFNSEFVLAGLFILFSGMLDMLDGKIARLTKQTSIFGAIYDATVDRIGELAIYTGIGAWFIMRNMHHTTLIVVIAVGGSMLISYVRARAESYDIPCTVGVLRRGDRIFLLGFGALLNFTAPFFHDLMLSIISLLSLTVTYTFPPMPLAIALVVIAVLSPITVVQRLLYIRSQEQSGL